MTNYTEQVKSMRVNRDNHIIEDYTTLKRQNQLATRNALINAIANKYGVTNPTVRNVLIKAGLYNK